MSKNYNHEFGLPGRLNFTTDTAGQIQAEVSNEHASARLALQGAHLLDWTPRGQSPLLWVSPRAVFAPGKAVRGGIPICWPWFGPHPERADYPSHGIARTASWEPIASRQLDDGGTALSLRLQQDEGTARFWQRPSRLELHLRIGRELELDLSSFNTGERPLHISQALHSYFRISDIGRVSISGLEDLEYVDKVQDARRDRQCGALRIHKETDRVYLDAGSECVLEDPGLARRIRIHQSGAASVVVWNPWHEKAIAMSDIPDDGFRQMVCVESANALNNGVSVAPGAEHHLRCRFGLEDLS